MFLLRTCMDLSGIRQVQPIEVLCCWVIINFAMIPCKIEQYITNIVHYILHNNHLLGRLEASLLVSRTPFSASL